MVYDSQKKVILSVRKRAMILGFQKEKKKKPFIVWAAIHVDRNKTFRLYMLMT